MEQAVIREDKEETGMVVQTPKFLFWQEFVYDSSFWKRRHFLFFDYTCCTESSEVWLNDEAEDHLWIKPEKALELPIDSYTRVSVLEYLKIHPAQMEKEMGEI